MPATGPSSKRVMRIRGIEGRLNAGSGPSPSPRHRSADAATGPLCVAGVNRATLPLCIFMRLLSPCSREPCFWQFPTKAGRIRHDEAATCPFALTKSTQSTPSPLMPAFGDENAADAKAFCKPSRNPSPHPCRMSCANGCGGLSIIDGFGSRRRRGAGSSPGFRSRP